MFPSSYKNNGPYYMDNSVPAYIASFVVLRQYVLANLSWGELDAKKLLNKVCNLLPLEHSEKVVCMSWA
jgi:hypothetical protein